MEHQSIRQTCLPILSQAVGLTMRCPDEGDGQTWFSVDGTSVLLGVAESPDGQAIALLVCDGRPPVAPPGPADIAIEEGDLPRLFDGGGAGWALVSGEHIDLHVKGDTGEAVAIKRLTRADFELADMAATLTDWVRRAVSALG